MRDGRLKISDIKHIRRITMLLGKLGIKSCSTHFDPPPPPWGYSANHPEWRHGLGLKETKDLVERTFDYTNDPLPPKHRQQLQKHNQIQEIKATRYLMYLLKEFGVSSADTGLAPCRLFTNRMRAKR